MNFLVFTVCMLASLIFAYGILSPRFAPAVYRVSLFTDKEARPSRPALVRSFDWESKQNLSIAAADGTALNAWYFHHQNDVLALYCIGRCSNVSNCLPDIKRLLRAGYSVLIGEYRGFGESPGRPTVDSICLDGLAFFDYAVQELDYHPKHIVIYGESMGGGVGAYVAATRRPGGLVLRNTFTSLPAIGREKVPLVRIYPDWMYPDNHLQTESVLRHWQRPLLIVHSVRDETVPFHHAIRLFDAAAENPHKRLLQLYKSTHRNIAAGPDSKSFVEALVELRRRLPTFN